MKRFLLLLLPALLGCLNVKPVDVSKTLDKSEDPITPVAAHVKVAVIAAGVEPELSVDGSGGDGAAPLKDTAPPAPVDANPRIKVPFTPRYQEAYPSLTHMEAAVPAALKELGFDAVTVQSPEEARSIRAAWVLQLQQPEIEGFRRAQGGGVRLEGTVYDFHVTYRGLLSPVGGAPLGLITGHGQAKTNLWFDDQYLETAIVGAVGLVVMAVVTALVAIPTGWFLFYNYREKGLASPPVGRCDNGPAEAQRVCPQVAWMTVGVAAASLLAITASAVLGFSTFIGSQIFTGVTAGIKGALSGPIWEGMVKQAHDQAARSLAAQLGKVTAPPPARVGGSK